MTKSEAKPTIGAVNELFSKSPDGLREIVRAVMQEMLEAEMTDAVGAEKGERTGTRLGYRSGYFRAPSSSPASASSSCACRRIATAGSRPSCSNATSARNKPWWRRWRRCMCRGLDPKGEGDHRGAVRPFLLGLGLSAVNKRLDESLDAFANRPLAEPFPYLILDARYEKVREGGVVMSQAVLIAIGIDWDGSRQILAVDMANRESRWSWKDFLLGLRRRGLTGVEFVVADDHAGLRSAVREVLAKSAFQRCYVHFLRNALDHLPRKADDDCLQELRRLYDRRSIEEARQDLAAWIAKWGARYPKLVSWVEETIEETLAFYRLPRQHHKHLKSTNMLERLDEEIKRRTHVVRIFPDARPACASSAL